MHDRYKTQCDATHALNLLQKQLKYCHNHISPYVCQPAVRCICCTPSESFIGCDKIKIFLCLITRCHSSSVLAIPPQPLPSCITDGQTGRQHSSSPEQTRAGRELWNTASCVSPTHLRGEAARKAWWIWGFILKEETETLQGHFQSTMHIHALSQKFLTLTKILLASQIRRGKNKVLWLRSGSLQGWGKRD